MEEKDLGGRPPIYTKELANKICERLSNGESLRSICRDKDMPSGATVFKWMREIDGFLKQYEIAKEESADALVEDMLDIADDKTGDVKRDRLRVDTRKWAASKLKAKKYGDKIDMTTNGESIQPLLVKIIGDEQQSTDNGNSQGVQKTV